MNAEQILSVIDYALLRPDISDQDIMEACELAVSARIAAVAVNPYWVQLASQYLYESEVAVCSTVGFPFGITTAEVKGGEAYNAVIEGATELDVVINIGAAKSGDFELIHDEIEFLVSSAEDAAEVNDTGPIIVKAIIETCYLDEEEKVEAIMSAIEGGVDFVKTSTGFGPSGATVEDVALMRRIAPPEIGVKAAGGIRTLNDVRAMLNAGADRIGTSALAAILKELG